jgi:ribitol 2-dehydrogenase
MSGVLSGSSALVTGASRGIGLAIARMLVAAGGRVALLARDSQRLAALAAELGDAAHSLPCDLEDPGSVDRALATLAEWYPEGPDILVQNAGTFLLAPIEATTPAAMERLIRTNLLGPFRLLHALAPRMRQRGSGHIVTIGSVADHQAMAGNTAYAASKFAARAVHLVLREEYRGSGVRVSLVSPGPVDTELWDRVDEAVLSRLVDRERMLAPEDVAEAVLWVVTRPKRVDVDEVRLSRF